MQLVARLFVTLLALGGIAGAIFVIFGLQDGAAVEKKVSERLRVASIDAALKLPAEEVAKRLGSPQQIEEYNADVDRYLWVQKGYWFVYAAAGLGLLGIILVLCGQGPPAALLLLLAPLGPALIMPPATAAIVGLLTAALPVAGLIAFFVHPQQPETETDAETELEFEPDPESESELEIDE